LPGGGLPGIGRPIKGGKLNESQHFELNTNHNYSQRKIF